MQLLVRVDPEGVVRLRSDGQLAHILLTNPSASESRPAALPRARESNRLAEMLWGIY